MNDYILRIKSLILRDFSGKMRKILVFLFMMIFIAMTSSSAMCADIMQIGAGARSISLGRAYVGELGDANSMLLNPAGINKITTFELSSMYANFASDVSYTVINAALPTEFGVIGIGYTGSSIADLMITTMEETGRIGSIGSFNYGSNVMYVSYAGQPTDNLYLGISGKYYSKGASQISDGTGAGMSVDLGAMYKVNENIRLGLSGQNLFNTGIKWENGVNESIPYNLRAGMVLTPNDKLTVMLDAEKQQGSQVLFKAGSEFNIWKNLWIRGGAEQMSQGEGQSYINYTGGVGLKIGELKIDYAYYRDTLVLDNSTHFVSITIDFPVYGPGRVFKEEAAQERVEPAPQGESIIIEEDKTPVSIRKTAPVKKEIKKSVKKAKKELRAKKKVKAYQIKKKAGAKKYVSKKNVSYKKNYLKKKPVKTTVKKGVKPAKKSVKKIKR